MNQSHFVHGVEKKSTDHFFSYNLSMICFQRTIFKFLIDIYLALMSQILVGIAPQICAL